MKTLLLFLIFFFSAHADLPISTYPTRSAWERIGVKDHIGIDVPLLCIHSSHSSGNGEFLDLIPLINWLANNGMDILQLLPLNDTGDIASPYSPLSFNALHPIYISLESLPFLTHAKDLKNDLKNLKAYNQTPRVEYTTVLQKKREWLKKYVKAFSEKLQNRPFYKAFLTKTTPWLDSYALYKVLRDHYGTHWETWPEELQTPTHPEVDNLKKQYQQEMLFYKIVQSLCFEQMEYVHHYANQKGVFLLGDMTFLIDHNSFETWRHPDAFKLNFSTGTPPDIFQPQGQYWGLPPYNWEAIESTHLHLITDRVQTFSWIYDLYRLDFCKGYFYQYEIPRGSSPKEGKFVPQTLEQAVKNGKEVLTEMAHTSNTLPVAEDLGMAMATQNVLVQFGIPGWQIFVYTNSKNAIADQILPGENAPILSVSQISNHDNPPLRLWWKENPDRAKVIAAKEGWTYSPELSLKQQQQLLWQDLHSASLFHIELLHDVLPPHLTKSIEEQRINYPGTLSDNNWTYRYKLSVEEILHNPETSQMIRTLLSPTPPLGKAS